MEYQTRLRHFTIRRDGGTFIVTSEIDDNFRREVKLGGVISEVAQRTAGNPFEAQEAIHRVMYVPIWAEWEQYQDGDAPADDTMDLSG